MESVFIVCEVSGLANSFYTWTKPKPEQGTPRYMLLNAVDHNEHHLVTEARSITRRFGIDSDETKRAWIDAVDALVQDGQYNEAMDRLHSLSRSIDLGSTPHLLTLNLELLRLMNHLGHYDQVATCIRWCGEFAKQAESISGIDSEELVKLAAFTGTQLRLAEPTASESSSESGSRKLFAVPIVSDLIEGKPYYSELKRIISSWREHTSSTRMFEEALPILQNLNLVSDKILLTHFLALELVSFPGGSEALIAEDIRQLINFWSIAAAAIIDPVLFAEHENIERPAATLSSVYQKLPATVASSPIWTPLRAITFLQGLSTWPVANIMEFAESQFANTDSLGIDEEHHKSIFLSLDTLREIYKPGEHDKDSALNCETSHFTVEQQLNSMIRRGLYEGKMGLVKSSLELLADHLTSLDISEKRSSEMQVLTNWFHRFSLCREVIDDDIPLSPSSDNRHIDFSGFVLAESNLVLGQAAKMIKFISISELDTQSMKHWVLDVERKYTATSLEYVTANYTLCTLLEIVDPKTAVKRLRKQRNALVNAGFSNSEFLADITLREIDALYVLGRDRECVESAESLLVAHSPLSTEAEFRLRIAQLRSTANMRQKNDSAIELIKSGEKTLLLWQPSISKKLERSLRIELMRNSEILGDYSRGLELALPMYEFQTTSELQHEDAYLLTSIARFAALTSNKEIEEAAWTALSTLETPMNQFYRIRSQSTS